MPPPAPISKGQQGQLPQLPHGSDTPEPQFPPGLIYDQHDSPLLGVP